MPVTLVDNPATAFVVPMAISLGWGVVFATVITLFLVPSLVLILDDLLPARDDRKAQQQEPFDVLHASGR